jgi:hypothetical protein
MDAQVLNFKAYSSGSMAGFFDLGVCGLVITGCKAFRKPSENGEERIWFGWPSEKTQDKEGADRWREIVTAAEPVMRHLQGLVRPQLRALLEAGGDQAPKPAGKPRFAGSAFQGEHGDRAYQESRRAAKAADDIPF